MNITIKIPGTDRYKQTEQILIRMLLKEHSDQGLHCLPFHSIFWTHTCIAKPNHTIFRTIIMVNIVGVAIFRIFMVHAYIIVAHKW